MNVDLDKLDIIQLLKGIGPGSYDDMTLCGGYGELGRGEQWVWDNEALRAASEESLWALYQTLKNRRDPRWL